MVLRPLPVATFGQVAKLGLVVEVWCMKCKSSARIDPADPRWASRGFAGARLACTRPGCGGPGVCSIEPVERITVESTIRRAFLMCVRCVPPWQILDVRPDQPPWLRPHKRPLEPGICPPGAI